MLAAIYCQQTLLFARNIFLYRYFLLRLYWWRSWAVLAKTPRQSLKRRGAIFHRVVAPKNQEAYLYNKNEKKVYLNFLQPFFSIPEEQTPQEICQTKSIQLKKI